MRPKFYYILLSIASGSLGAICLAASPSKAITYTFQDAYFRDTINQNIGVGQIIGSFDAPTGTSIATSTAASITINLSPSLNPPTPFPPAPNTPVGAVNGSSSYLFNRVYYTNVGGNNALVFYCTTLFGTCTNTSDNGNPNGFDPNGTGITYQLVLGFNQNINFGDPNTNFPSTINLQSLNNGNINQLCTSLASSIVGTNNCNNGENNRVELKEFAAGSLLVPFPLGIPILVPLASTLLLARKRYLNRQDRQHFKSI